MNLSYIEVFVTGERTRKKGTADQIICPVNKHLRYKEDNTSTYMLHYGISFLHKKVELIKEAGVLPYMPAIIPIR